VARAEGKSQNETTAPREFVRVYNTESEAAPALAALEVCGYDKAENLFYVCKPTVSGRNDCLFNTRTPIAAGGTGQAVATGAEALALYQPDGNPPASGQIWGTVAGSWALSPRSTGYVVRFLASANRSALVVAPAPASLEEWVRITGVNPGGKVPRSYYPAVVVKLNVGTDEYEDSVVSCWWRDAYKEAPGVGEIIKSSHTGNGGPTTDYRPLYVGRTEDGGDISSSSSSAGPRVVTLVECFAGANLRVVSGVLTGTVTVRGRQYPVNLSVS